MMTTGGVANIGGRVDFRFNPTEMPGLVVGLQGQTVTRGSGACPCLQSRSLLALGYSIAASRTSEWPLGVELLGLVGGGAMPTAHGQVVSGLLWGGELDFPIRLGRRRELWQSDEYVGTTFALVPVVSLLGSAPKEGDDPSVALEGSVCLAFRAHIYTAVLP